MAPSVGRLPLRASTCALAIAFAWVFARAVSAATFSATLPTVTAAPGTVVQVPITVTPAPAGLGVFSIDYRVTFDPAAIQSSQSVADGFLQSWGAAFANATSSFVAAAAAGATPTTSASTLLNTIALTIKPGAVVGTDVPLVFEHLTFNNGTPSVATTNGVLKIRNGAGVDALGAASFALAPASPNPAADRTRLAFRIADGARGAATLVVHALDGARVRTLLDGPLAPGAHDADWDLRDDRGRRVAPGLYFARLSQGGETRVRRLVVVE